MTQHEQTLAPAVHVLRRRWRIAWREISVACGPPKFWTVADWERAHDILDLHGFVLSSTLREEALEEVDLGDEQMEVAS